MEVSAQSLNRNPWRGFMEGLNDEGMGNVDFETRSALFFKWEGQVTPALAEQWQTRGKYQPQERLPVGKGLELLLNYITKQEEKRWDLEEKLLEVRSQTRTAVECQVMLKQQLGSASARLAELEPLHEELLRAKSGADAELAETRNQMAARTKALELELQQLHHWEQGFSDKATQLGNLQQAHDRLMEEHEELKQKLLECRCQLRSERQAHRSTSNTSQSQAQDLARLEKQKAEGEDTIRELRERKEKLEETNQKLSDTLKAVKHEKLDTLHNLFVTQAEHSFVQQQLQMKEDDYEKLSSQHAAACKDMRSLNRKLATTRHQLAQAKRAIDDQGEDMARLEREMKALQQAHAALKERKQDLEAANRQAHDTMQAMRHEKAEAQHDLFVTQGEHEYVMNCLKIKSDDFEELSQRHATLDKASRGLRVEMADRGRELKRTQRALEDLRQVAEGGEQRMREMEQAHAALKERKDDLEGQARSLTATVAGLIKEKAEVMHDRFLEKDGRKELEKRHVSICNHRQELSGELQASRKQVVSLEKMNAKLQAELKAAGRGSHLYLELKHAQLAASLAEQKQAEAEGAQLQAEGAAKEAADRLEVAQLAEKEALKRMDFEVKRTQADANARIQEMEQAVERERAAAKEMVEAAMEEQERISAALNRQIQALQVEHEEMEDTLSQTWVLKLPKFIREKNNKARCMVW